MTPHSGPDARRNNFDFFRFVLASLVIFSHSYLLASGSNAGEPLFRLTRGYLNLGALAVDGFFILSGFLITASWQRGPRFPAFMAKRILRIYPGLAVSVLLSFLAVCVVCPVAGPGGMLSLRQLWAVARSILIFEPYYLAGLFPHNPLPGFVNGSLWTIKYEFLCYVFVALLGISGLLKRRATVLAGFLACCVLSFVVARWAPELRWPDFGHPRWVQPVYLLLGGPANWPRFLAYYLAGVAAHLYRRELSFTPLRAVVAALAILAAVFAAPQYLSVILPIAFGYLILYGALDADLGVQRFGAHGDFSYGIYLYAFPIQQILMTAGHWQPLALSLVAWPCAIAAGVASWYAVERPFLRLKPKTGPRDRVAAAPTGTRSRSAAVPALELIPAGSVALVPDDGEGIDPARTRPRYLSSDDNS